VARFLYEKINFEMRLIHEQHPHRRIELVICIIYGCSVGCDASNHKVGIGNGHHDVELYVGELRLATSACFEDVSWDSTLRKRD